jgi:acetyltransferase-like isoleucine patch superfamily enzyme
MARTIFNKVWDKFLSWKTGAILVNSRTGNKVFISKNSFLSNSNIGDYSSIGRNSTLVHATLGRYCSVSWNVTIGATQHPMNRISSHAFPYVKKFGFVTQDHRFATGTQVGHDVWIGANGVVMPGIKIGNGAVIGASSVVTKDIPDFAIVAGIPAKVVRYRFPEEVIARLNKSAWWNLEPDLIRKHIADWQEDLNEEVLSRLERLCAS